MKSTGQPEKGICSTHGLTTVTDFRESQVWAKAHDRCEARQLHDSAFDSWSTSEANPLVNWSRSCSAYIMASSRLRMAFTISLTSCFDMWALLSSSWSCTRVCDDAVAAMSLPRSHAPGSCTSIVRVIQ
jgi:hypothetical protein